MPPSTNRRDAFLGPRADRPRCPSGNAGTIYDTLAFVQAKLKDYAGAAASLQIAMQLEPNNPEWRIRRAGLYSESGQRDRATRVLQEIDAAYPDNGRLDKGQQMQLEKLRGTLDLNTAMAPPGG